MNKFMMSQLADLIESIEPVRFNIHYWTGRVDWSDENVSPKYIGHNYQHDQYIDINDCGTAGCIAGWTLAMTSIKPVQYNAEDFSNKAAFILGLSEMEASDLFLMNKFWYRNRFKLGIPTMNTGDDDSDYYCECHCDIANNVHYCGYEIDGDKVTAEVAAKALRMIINGDLRLKNGEYDYE